MIIDILNSLPHDAPSEIREALETHSKLSELSLGYLLYLRLHADTSAMKQIITYEALVKSPHIAYSLLSETDISTRHLIANFIRERNGH